MMDPNNLPHHVYLHKDHKYRLKLGFYAAPSNPKAFSKAIRDELNNLKFTYCSDLNGLIMGFGKISSNELIPADIRHCINVVVNVDVFIFKPPVGSIIKAVVNQTSDNHVSCLVHNLFNVSIVRPENKPYDQWSGSKIKKDDKIDVKVLSFDLTKKLPHITGEIIKKKNECNDPKNIKNSSTKSSSSKNIVRDFAEFFNKNTASTSTFSSNGSDSDEMNNIITESKICADESTKTSPILINTTFKHTQKKDTNAVSSSKLSSSDSESSAEINNMIISSKIYEDKSTKKSPLLINTTVKHVENEDTAVGFSTLSSSDFESSNEINNIINKSKIWFDEPTKTSPLSINTSVKRTQKKDSTAVSSSKLSSSDSESSAEINNMITSSKICEDKSTKKSPVSTNTTIKHQDTADSSSEFSSSNSELSSKIKVELTNFEECNKNKSTRTSSRICNNINYTKHIESPLYSSTPILNSENSINSINLIRNKQLEQLKKHLAKNSSGKRKSLASVEVPNQFAKDKLSQSLNNLQQNIKNSDNYDNPFEVLAASVNFKDNLGSANKINQHGSLQGDSGLSDSDRRQNISINNSFTKKKSEKSTKTTKKHRKSNEIVDAILNSIGLNKKKSYANTTKHLVDSNNECSNDKKEENSIYTQHKHNLDEELIIHCKHLNEPVVKKSLTLNLSTKNIKGEDTPPQKNTDDSENQIKNKISKKCSKYVTLSMISDSDSNCSKDLKLPVKDLSRKTDFNKEIENDTSSSDDEIYSKLRQNISKTQINTNHCNEKPKSQSLDYNKVWFSTEESDSSSKLFYNNSELSSQLIKSNVTNISETDGCNKSNDNLSSTKNRFKKDKKKKEVNEKSTHPKLSSKIVDKMDIIKHILDRDSTSDGEVTTLQNKISDKKKKKGKVSKKKSILNVSKLNQNDGLLNKEISNPLLKIYTENITSSSSDDEMFVKNLLKSKKKSSDKKKIIPLVDDEEKKNILINQVLSSIKRKNKKQKQILPVSQNNSKASEIKNDKITMNKSIVKTKNKKNILNILKNSIGEPKPNVLNLNISQKVNSSQLNIQPSSNETTDDKKVIKKMLKKQKLKKAYVPEQSMKINISTKSNEQNEIKEKLQKKSKSQDVSMKNEVKSNDIKKKKKRPRETKDSFIDSIISALENSSSDYAPSKKKKKDHNLAIEESHESKDKNSGGNLSEVKRKKKKKSKHKDSVNVIDLIVKDNKKKPNDSLFESLPKDIQAKVDNTCLKVSKKKKKNDPVLYKTQSTITDKSNKIIDKLEDDNVQHLKKAGSSKKKTRKVLKSFMLTQDNTHLDHLYDLLNTHLINS